MFRVIPVIFMLCACSTVPAVKLQCLPLKPYTQAQQDALAAALQSTPDTSPFTWAMLDYGQMRAADRACLAAK